MHGAAHSILLVEDDPALALGLVDTFEFEGFNVTHASTGQDAIDHVGGQPPDCIILDLMLPDMNGYQICESIRKKNAQVPILMLTARSQEVDKVRGLNAGADDYVTKPFGVSELVARVRALLRRSQANLGAEKPFAIGDTIVDPAAQELRRGDEVIELTHHELSLLSLLWVRQGQAVTRDEILDRVWGIESSPTNRTVDNVVVKLRKKLDDSSEKPKHLHTVYGVGYKLLL